MTDFMWCDHEGTAHEDVDDPYAYGPAFPDWVDDLEFWKVDDAGILHYVCPGPHVPVGMPTWYELERQGLTLESLKAGDGDAIRTVLDTIVRQWEEGHQWRSDSSSKDQDRT